jgi:hypothetical protein
MANHRRKNSKSDSNKVKYNLLIAGLGAVLLIIGFVLVLDLAINGVVKTGVVVDYERVSYPKSSVTHSHTIKLENELVKVSLSKKNSLGSEVTLQYIPKRPKNYWVKKHISAGDQIGLFGLLLLSYGLIRLWFEKN